MKFRPVVFLKSLNWSKQDFKIILMFIIMLLIGCLIIGSFLFFKTINVRIIQNGLSNKLSVDGSVDANVRWGQGAKTN